MAYTSSIRSFWAGLLLLAFASGNLLSALHHWDGHEHERMTDCHAEHAGDLHWHVLDHELTSCGLHELNSPPYQPGLSIEIIPIGMSPSFRVLFTYRSPLSQKEALRLSCRAPPVLPA